MSTGTVAPENLKAHLAAPTTKAALAGHLQAVHGQGSNVEAYTKAELAFTHRICHQREAEVQAPATAEVQSPGPTAAEDRAERIRRSLTTATADIIAAWQERDWEKLGYKDWAAYCEGEFGSGRVKLATPDRDRVIEALAATGMSTRAIASAAGTSQATVSRVSRSGESSDSPGRDRGYRRVTGTDGKSYGTAPRSIGDGEAEPPAPLSAVVAAPPPAPVDGQPAAGQAQPEAQEQAVPRCAHKDYVLACKRCGEHHPSAADIDVLWLLDRAKQAEAERDEVAGRLAQIEAQRDRLAARVADIEEEVASLQAARDSADSPPPAPARGNGATEDDAWWEMFTPGQ